VDVGVLLALALVSFPSFWLPGDGRVEVPVDVIAPMVLPWRPLVMGGAGTAKWPLVRVAVWLGVLGRERELGTGGGPCVYRNATIF